MFSHSLAALRTMVRLLATGGSKYIPPVQLFHLAAGKLSFLPLAEPPRGQLPRKYRQQASTAILRLCAGKVIAV